MEAFTGPDDQSLFVSDAEGQRGLKGPFYVVYADSDGDTRWGFRCGNCNSADTAVDPMGRVQCNQCKNRTKAEQWDAAHE